MGKGPASALHLNEAFCLVLISQMKKKRRPCGIRLDCSDCFHKPHFGFSQQFLRFNLQRFLQVKTKEEEEDDEEEEEESPGTRAALAMAGPAAADPAPALADCPPWLETPLCCHSWGSVVLPSGSAFLPASVAMDRE